jgi:hypothetical protein
MLPLLEYRCCEEPVACILMSLGYVILTSINSEETERL